MNDLTETKIPCWYSRVYILSLIVSIAVGIACTHSTAAPPPSNLCQATKKQRIVPPDTKETTYLRGVVQTLDGTAIEGAEVEVDRLPGQKVKTATAGDFSIQNIPGTFGDQARVYVRCPGYKSRNEYIFLPGPVRIRLDREGE